MVDMLLDVGIVRLMAVLAGHRAGVLGGYHLWKVPGLGRVLLVAAPAQIRHLGQFGDIGSWVTGMLRQGTVTRLARNVCVFSRSARFALILVAEQAGLLPGVGNGPLPDHLEGAWPVVAVFAEVLWNDGAADDEEDPDPGQENHGRPDQVPRITERTSQVYPLFQRKFDGTLAIQQPTGPMI
jgi:hypothetical protein